MVTGKLMIDQVFWGRAVAVLHATLDCNIFISCLSISARMCICAVDTCGAHRDQKRTSDPLKLELQVVVS